MKEGAGAGYDLTGLFIADTLDGTEGNGSYADMQSFYKPSSGDYIARHGGYWTGDALYGLFSVHVNLASSVTGTYHGARLAKR
jgi:hypothetical protein